MRNCCFNSLNT